MIEGAGRANLNTAGVSAVHAGAASKEPPYLSPRGYLPELHLEPGGGRKVGRVLIAAAVNRRYPIFGSGYELIVLVPLLTGGLTATAGGTSDCVI